MRRVVAPLAAVCLIVFCCACRTPSAGAEPEEPVPDGAELLPFLRGFGDAAIRTAGTEALRKYAPEAIALIDRPGPNGEPPDGMLTFAECEAIVAAGTPQQLEQRFLWLGIMAAALVAARN